MGLVANCLAGIKSLRSFEIAMVCKNYFLGNAGHCPSWGVQINLERGKWFLMKCSKLIIFLVMGLFFISGQPALSAEPKAKGAADECVEPAAGPIVQNKDGAKDKVETNQALSSPVIARVGGKAPDFEAPAYFNGGFKNIKLSDYKGKWVVLCFYPGDFTFV